MIVSEDTCLLCASSNILTTNWYFSKEKDEEGTIIDDNINVNESGLYSEGILRLQITYPLPDGKIGYYTCTTYEVESTSTLRIVNYTLFITNPFHTETTTRIDKTVNTTQTHIDITVTNTTTETPTIPITNTTTNIPTIPITNTTTNIPTIPITNTTTNIPTNPVTNTTTKIPTIPVTNTTTNIPTIPITNTTTKITTIPITNTTTNIPTIPVTNTTMNIPTIPVTNTTTKITTIPITNTTTNIPTIPITNMTTKITTIPITNTTTKITTIPITNTTTKITTIPITNTTTNIPTIPITNMTTKITTIPITNTTTKITTIPVTNTTTKITTIPITNTTTKITTIPITNTTTKITTIPITNTTTKITTIPITNTTTKITTIPVTNTTTKITTIPITNTTTKITTIPITNTTTKITTIPITNTTTKIPTIPVTNTTTKITTIPITNTTTKITTIPITNTTTKITTIPITNTTTENPTILVTNTTTENPTIPITQSYSVPFTNATTQVSMPIPTLNFLNIETLAPYLGAFIGLILFILMLVCICIFCLGCILKRRSKSKKASLVYKQLHSVARDQNLENRNHITTKYSQLIDPEAALAALTCSASNEAPTSPNKKTSLLPQKDIETGASAKTSLETFIYDGNMSKTSLSKYQNNIHSEAINLEHYKQLLDELLVEGRMEAEYKSLGGQELRYEWHQASLLQNVNRNRYKRIYPYDRSRVVIRDTSYVGSDFINASHVPGFYSPEHFIAAQAPKPNTLNSFWQMIWEQRIQSIVMLTNLEEMGKKKCTQYWPESVGAAVQCGSVRVSLLKEETLRGYVTRELLVDRLNQRQMKIKQFHYTAWPDRDTPELYDSLLAFIQIVKSRQMNIGSPVLVHCSGGVGGSGTFIALYNLLDAIGRGEAISVYRLVNEMREYRPHMVQTFPQYKYIYLATLEIIMGSTSIASEYFRDTFRLYLQAEEPGYLSVFQLQFAELNYQTEKSFNYPSTLSATYPDKNLVSAALPHDRNRVVLTNSASSDYINASYMNSQQIIATLIPNSETVEEFLQLVHQLDDPVVVLLMTEGEYEEMREGICDRVSYWREDRGSREFKSFQVETDNVIRSPFFKQQRMVISNHAEREKRYFSQYISLNWTEDGRITDLTAVVTLLDHVSILLSDKPNRSAIFCCNDGIGKSGVALTAMQAIRDMSETSSFDVFQTVKRLRNARKNTVSTIVSINKSDSYYEPRGIRVRKRENLLKGFIISLNRMDWILKCSIHVGSIHFMLLPIG